MMRSCSFLSFAVFGYGYHDSTDHEPQVRARADDDVLSGAGGPLARADHIDHARRALLVDREPE
jgi:hypothetical protein